MAETIGALIIELRSNSAQFAAEMDQARNAARGVGHGAALSSQQLSRFAAIAVRMWAPLPILAMCRTHEWARRWAAPCRCELLRDSKPHLKALGA